MRRAALILVAVGLLGALGLGTWLVVDETQDRPDAIVVLASHEFERLPGAWQLALRHPDAVVVLSYPAAPTPANCQDCAGRVDRLVRWGIPRSRIVVTEAPVWNSYDELVAAVGLARSRGWTAIQVVTSPYHTRRVVGLARRAVGEGGEPRVGVVGVSAEPVRPGLWWSRRYDGRYVVYEVAALIVNGWRYGIWPWQWRPGPDVA